MFKPSRDKTVASTPLSDFLRNASSKEKKRVYRDVLTKASERQNRTLEEAEGGR
jgi:ribosomal protein L18E